MTSRTFSRQRLGARGPLGLVAEEVAVLLEVRPAAGGVDHDGVDLGALEGLDDLAGEAEGLLLAPAVRRQRAAAALPRRDDDVAALGRQHADRRRVDVGEEGPLHAAGQQPDRPAAGTGRRGVPRDPLDRAEPGRERLHGLQRPRQPGQEPAADQQIPQAGRLVQPQRPAGGPQAAGIGEEGVDDPARCPVGQGTPVPALHLGARGLDQLVVLHAGGTRRHARHAAQALVEVPDRRVLQRIALEPLLHQVDAAAGAVHLLAPQHVRGAGREAEAAVHAVADQRRVRRVVVVEGRLSAAPADRGPRGRPAGGGVAARGPPSARSARRGRPARGRAAAGLPPPRPPPVPWGGAFRSTYPAAGPRPSPRTPDRARPCEAGASTTLRRSARATSAGPGRTGP